MFASIRLALQPWTPCLPIRGGKLKTSKPFSTSNPQLPFLCNASGSRAGAQNISGTNSAAAASAAAAAVAAAIAGGSQKNQQQQISTNSLNSSYIWREASPNNFNLYSSSVSSLNTTSGFGGYRYSLTGASAGVGAGAGAGAGGNKQQNIGQQWQQQKLQKQQAVSNYQRALSEERATRKSLNRLKSGFGSGYDNIFTTPLLPRKNKTSPKLMKNNSISASSSSYQAYQQQTQLEEQQQQQQQQLLIKSRKNSTDSMSTSTKTKIKDAIHPGLYDRRLNRSFEATTTTTTNRNSATNRYAGYGGGYMMGYAGLRTNAFQRSTPHLAGTETDDSDGGGSSGGGGGDGGYYRDQQQYTDNGRQHRYGCGATLLRGSAGVGGANCANGSDCSHGGGGGGGGGGAVSDTQRHSGSWCCGNFVIKQWRKINNY